MITLALTAAGTLGSVSQPLAEPQHLPPATEQQVRARAAELVGLADRNGPGRATGERH